jgi:hypothetical protein
MTSQLYGRYDLLLRPGQRLLLSPGVVLHAGNSPNGENPGYVLGLTQGVGLELEGQTVSLIPSASVVVARGERSSYGASQGSFVTAFGTASVAISLHRRRAAAGPPSVPPASSDGGR